MNTIMGVRRARARILAGMLSLAIVLGLMIATPPATAHAAAGVCGPHTSKVRIKITSPKPQSRIDLSKTPRFTVAGMVSGSKKVVRVDLYEGRTRIGRATLVHKRWQLTTSAPPGRHTLTACAVTRSGKAAKAGVTIISVAPSATKTLVNPAVHALSPTEVRSVAKVAASQVTFRRTNALRPGQVLVAGITPTTPQGLLRIITAVTQHATTTVISTKPAALTDVFLQFHSDLQTPLSPASPSRRESGPVRRSQLGGTLWSHQVSSGISYAGQEKNGNKWSVDGSLEIEQSLRGTLDTHIDIDIAWSWGLPHPTLKEFSMVFTASLPTNISLKAAITGTHTITEHLATVRLAVIALSELPPIVLFPVLSLDQKLAFAGSVDTGFSVTTTAALQGGFEYRDGHFRGIGSSSIDHKTATPLDSTPNVGGSVSLSTEAELTMSVDGAGGPSVATELGFKASDTYPCPGRFGVDAFLSGSVGATLQLLGHDIAEKTITLAEISESLYESRALGCDGRPVVSTSIPGAAVGQDYSTVLRAGGGEEPYTWVITGLPPGLHASVDGTVSGTPTEAGSYSLRAIATDAAGHASTATEIPLRVAAPPALVLSDSVPDAITGVAYSTRLIATGGSAPYTFSSDDQDLPTGWQLDPDGHLSGRPSAAGTLTFSVRVRDAAAKTAAAVITLHVYDELPAPVSGEPIAAPPNPGCPRLCSTTWGDPHLVTFDGVHYDLQRVGEFVAVASTTDDLEIQVRQAPYRGSRAVAGNVGVALRVAGHRLTLVHDTTGLHTRLDGSTVSADPVLQLPGGGSVVLDPAAGRETVTWPDRSFVTVHDDSGFLDLTVGLADQRAGHVRGLLGDASSDSDDEVGDGARWQVSRATSLFDYGSGESTQTYTDPDFPYATLTAAQLPQPQSEAARAACRRAGVIGTDLLEACVLDVAVTGRTALAGAAVTAQQVSDSSTVLAASSPGQSWTDTEGRSGTSAFTYGHVGCNDLTSANTCTSGVWGSVPGAPWVWTSQRTTAGQHDVTFTAEVTLTAAQAQGPLVLTAAADDQVVAAVNGTTVLTAGYNAPVGAAVDLHAGTNTLTFRVTNNGGDDPSTNPAGLAWKLSRG